MQGMRGLDELIGLRQGIMLEDKVVDQALIEERQVVGGAHGPNGVPHGGAVAERRRIRDERKFPSLEALRVQLEQDAVACSH